MADVEIHPTAKGTRSRRERSDEEQRKDALIYAGNAVKAAMDALAALDAIDLAGIYHSGRNRDSFKAETGERLMLMSRRLLREALDYEHEGYEPFMDLLMTETGIDLHC